MSQSPAPMNPPTMEPRPSTHPSVREKKRNRRAVLWTLLALFVVGTCALLYFRSKTPQNPTLRGGGMGRGRGGGGFGMGGPQPVAIKPAATGAIDVILKGLGTVTPLA